MKALLTVLVDVAYGIALIAMTFGLVLFSLYDYYVNQRSGKWPV